MKISVRVNRDHNKHRWTVHSLTHGTRLGSVESMLLQDVRFVREGPSGWADGDLVNWTGLQMDPNFPVKGLVPEDELLDPQRAFWPVEFRGGEFFVGPEGAGPLRGCSWLKIVGRAATAAGVSF